MANSYPLSQRRLHGPEEVGEALGLVSVNSRDPRTLAQFINDALTRVFLEEPSSSEAPTMVVIPGFSVARQHEGRSLDGAIAVGLHQFFVQHSTVVTSGEEFDYRFKNDSLDPVFFTAKDTLEKGYGITDYVDRKLSTPEYIKRHGTVKHRSVLAYVCLSATKRALIEKQFRTLPDKARSLYSTEDLERLALR